MRRLRHAAEKPYFETCFLCRFPFQFGRHAYDGRRIPQWDIMVCMPCFQGNWDGIVLLVTPVLLND
jgi:hypothetical protein